MKKNYLARISIALGLALLMTWGAYSIVISCDRKYFHTIGKNEFVLLEDTTAYDILLLGSSRMKNNVNPKVVDSVTNQTCFNAGSSGANAIEVNTILQSYLLQHKAPKYVVYSLDLFSLKGNNHLKNYPAYITCIESPPIAEALEQEGVPTFLYRHMPFLKIVELNDYYKGVVVKALKGHKDIPVGDFYYKGFVSNTDEVLQVDTVGPVRVFDVTAKGIEAVDKVVKTCRQNNIKLIFTYAPEYKSLNMVNVLNSDEVFAILDSISVANDVPFYRHEKLDLNTKRELFANNGHLNKKGADVYSIEFAKLFFDDKIAFAN